MRILSAANKTTVAIFEPGHRSTVTAEIFQYATGQILEFDGLDLPGTFHVDFSNYETKESSKPEVGSADTVAIPGEFLRTGLPVYAFIVLSEGQDDAATEYVVQIPVRRRPQPTDVAPDPEEQSVIDELIAELNDGRDRAEAAAGAAETAQGKAEDAQDLAEQWATGGSGGTPSSQNNARNYAVIASQQASLAEGAKQTAIQNAQAASQSAGYAIQARVAAQTAQGKAEDAAERAEQAAGTSGYLEIEIDENGHLIYTRTDAVDVDFELDNNGHLIMEVI